MTLSGAEVLARRGITAEPVPVASGLRFPDGAHYRIEIPSVEGPEVLRAVIDQAKAEGVTVNRVSQGSGPCKRLAEKSAVNNSTRSARMSTACNGMFVLCFTSLRSGPES